MTCAAFTLQQKMVKHAPIQLARDSAGGGFAAQKKIRSLYENDIKHSNSKAVQYSTYLLILALSDYNFV